MAKFTLVVFKNRQLQNKEFTIFVKLTHKGKKSFKATEFTCTSKDINDTGVVTNYKVITKVYTEFLEKWEEDLSKIEKIENKTCDEIIKIITNRETFTDTNDLDFFEFAEQHTNFVRESGRNGSADNFRNIANSLKLYLKSDKLAFSSITLSFIEKYALWLKIPKKAGNRRTLKALSDTSVNNYIRDFRTLYNAARKRYTDPVTGEEYIKTYPFKLYKFKLIPENGGFRSTSVENIRKMAALEGLTGRKELARDMFILSFCLMGINATDLYDLKYKDYAFGRLDYCRNKTKDRRSDSAFISVKVCTLAEQIMKRYKGNVRLLNFQSRYSELDTFIRAINEGLKSLTDEMEITRFTYYSARHSWATIARNECGISKDDVDMCLNHTSANKMADKYIKKSWDILDKANEKVLEYVFGSVEWV